MTAGEVHGNLMCQAGRGVKFREIDGCLHLSQFVAACAARPAGSNRTLHLPFLPFSHLPCRPALPLLRVCFCWVPARLPTAPRLPPLSATCPQRTLESAAPPRVIPLGMLLCDVALPYSVPSRIASRVYTSTAATLGEPFQASQKLASQQ